MVKLNVYNDIPRWRGQGVDFAAFFYNTIIPPGNGLREIIHNSSFIIHHFSLDSSY
jgi:hypothetical protein